LHETGSILWNVGVFLNLMLIVTCCCVSSFVLEFWENWYVIGENDKDAPEFKFIYYNGKTRQNTYEGAFVYSRTKDLAPESMKKVYQIAKDAGMDPKQFCRIRNGCFPDETVKTQEPETGLGSPSNPFRGILASTRVSELLGVEPVAARDTIRRDAPTAQVLRPAATDTALLQQQQKRGNGRQAGTGGESRKWWYEVGDYLENPHRHFQAMDSLRLAVEWPEDVVASAK
jgi:VDE lipocalin domain